MTRGKHKHLNRNIGLSVAVIAIILVAAATSIYFGSINTQKNQTPIASRALSVGDTFTYKLKGSTVIGSSDAVTPAEFLQYNNTQYYMVNVTAIEGTTVSLETTWQFKNGTQVRILR